MYDTGIVIVIALVSITVSFTADGSMTKLKIYMPIFKKLIYSLTF